jgi:hypothetical protein
MLKSLLKHSSTRKLRNLLSQIFCCFAAALSLSQSCVIVDKRFHQFFCLSLAHSLSSFPFFNQCHTGINAINNVIKFYVESFFLLSLLTHCCAAAAASFDVVLLSIFNAKHKKKLYQHSLLCV